MSGYFDLERFEENQRLYPNIAALDKKVMALRQSDKAKGWDTARLEVEIARIHPIYWMENYGYIKQAALEGGIDVGVRIIPFKLNPTQLQIANSVCSAFVSKPWKRVQKLILKHRKEGCSTLCAAFDYWLMRFVSNFGMFVIADLGSHTDNIVEMIALFHKRDECGKGLGVEFAPPKKMTMPKNKAGIKFSNGSMLEQDSGENSNPGTSGTIQGCHMSENAKWRDPQNAETSLLNSIPTKGFVFIIKESTAFGMNKWEKDCEEAEKGTSNWDFIFVSWKDLPDCEYELEVTEFEDEVIASYSDEEKELVETYKLRPGHVKFRRAKIEQLGSIQMFKQDYPLNSREPFYISGANYFNVQDVQDRIREIHFFRDWKTEGLDFVAETYPDIYYRLKHHPRGIREALARLENRHAEPKWYGMTLNRGKVSLTSGPEAQRDEAVCIFRLPDKYSQYLVVVDVAQGEESDEYVSDLSIIEVIETYHREQVAEWGGIFDEEITALYAVMLGQFFGNADIVIDPNNRCGALLETELKKTPYRHFYYNQRVDSQRTKRQMGFPVTVGNKREVCGHFKIDFKNGDCTVHSLDLLEEMMFFMDSKGKLRAAKGKTDDHVMAMCVGTTVIKSTPKYQQPLVSKRRERGETWNTTGVQRSPEGLWRERLRREKDMVLQKYR